MTTRNKVRYRQYQPRDYSDCERLVSQAWQFEQHFAPDSLAKLMAYFYTSGAPQMSNFSLVAEANGQVVGFIFGNNRRARQKKPSFGYSMQSLGKLVKLWCLPGEARQRKKDVFKRISQHSLNRRSLCKDWGSEVLLFVIAPEFQGQGIGSHMVKAFLNSCAQRGVDRVSVEANVVEAGRFYERVGFRYIDEFESPLHAACSSCDRAGRYLFRLDEPVLSEPSPE
ncbi:GNAT family N-acetyltransferase [Vibrio sp. WXL103]|uniref:GNAT family N-acetyltransferase n=1 Tax=unclassified Vibrio TaxID=2614977 RepID=UPI003EC93777